MAKTIIDKDLHFRLKEAGLISKAQIEIAQQDRLQHQNLELEEILTLRGWLIFSPLYCLCHDKIASWLLAYEK